MRYFMYKLSRLTLFLLLSNMHPTVNYCTVMEVFYVIRVLKTRFKSNLIQYLHAVCAVIVPPVHTCDMPVLY